MASLRYACLFCGTWTCEKCGWKDRGVSGLYSGHSCYWCHHKTGTLIPTMHTEFTWRRHNGDGPLPDGYPYGTQPEGELRAPFGSRTAVPQLRTYLGVPVTWQGPGQRVHLESWQRGVEDALKHSELAHKRTRTQDWMEGWDTAVETVDKGDATLSDPERKFLAFALDQAVLGESLAEGQLLGEQFTDEDRAALEKLRRLTADPGPKDDHA